MSFPIVQGEYVVPVVTTRGFEELRLPSAVVHALAEQMTGGVTPHTVEQAVKLLASRELFEAYRDLCQRVIQAEDLA